MKDLRAAWKANTTHDAADMLLFCLLRATQAKSNDKRQVLAGLIYKCFTPITNERKLANGDAPWQSVRTAANVIAVHAVATPQEAPRLAALYDCIETDEERVVYRQLLLALLNRSIKLTDRNYACFLIRQDIPREQQAAQTAQAAILLGRATGRQLRSQPIGNPSDLQIVVFGARNEQVFHRRMSEIDNHVAYVKTHRRVHTGAHASVQIVALCTMPIRASLIRRKRLFEGCERLVLGLLA